MKKIIGILGIVIVAVTFSFSLQTNEKNITDIDLIDLTTISKASAEPGTAWVSCTDVPPGSSGALLLRVCQGCAWNSVSAGTSGWCSVSW